MSNVLSSNLVEDIRVNLTSSNPDVNSIVNELHIEYNIDKKAARILLYHIVRELNLHLFPPLGKLELLLTRNCNLKCSYCFEQPIRGKEKMSESVALKAIDLLIDYSSDLEDLYITHFGGEPTLNFPLLQKVTEYAEERVAQKGKKVHFNMTSNGILFTDEMIEYFSNHNIKVLLSIDGLQSSHDKFRIDLRGKGSFDRVANTMKKLKRKMPWVGVKMTISKENLHQLYNDVIGLYELGVNQFLFGPVTNREWDKSDIDVYFKQMAKIYTWYKHDDKKIKISEFEDEQEKESYFGCQAGRDNISVDVDGTITGCSKILSLEETKVVGKLGDVEYGLTHIKDRMDYVSCDALKENCSKNAIVDNYYGGCFASNYDENKNVFEPNMYEHKFSIRMRKELDAFS